MTRAGYAGVRILDGREPWMYGPSAPACCFLAYFPLTLERVGRFTAYTTLPDDVFLGHWLLITAALSQGVTESTSEPSSVELRRGRLRPRARPTTNDGQTARVGGLLPPERCPAHGPRLAGKGGPTLVCGPAYPNGCICSCAPGCDALLSPSAPTRWWAGDRPSRRWPAASVVGSRAVAGAWRAAESRSRSGGPVRAWRPSAPAPSPTTPRRDLYVEVHCPCSCSADRPCPCRGPRLTRARGRLAQEARR
ncbi:hypothetical protein FY004_06455 [Streptomyces parvus]|uniref:Uncharacterized protein n=1 Tax=Streptomyces parvus TaxID=66428 RepID=A0A5D4JJ05_9ACTN|nr:hypothetical protein FY004_06455 [Streptomyces parvus]